MQQLSSGQRDAVAAIQRLGPIVESQRDQLIKYIAEFAGAEPSDNKTDQQFKTGTANTLSQELRGLSSSFHHAALTYATLYELALRLYEPRLREIAPKHMRAHADAALSTAQLLPAVVAWQLEQNGLYCACICPMCSLGACGCVAFGTQTLTNALRDAVLTNFESPGYVFPTPRPGSQLARTGMKCGDTVVEVDGLKVSNFEEIQAAFRKHMIGEEVRMQIQHGVETPRELNLRHVSDYPKK